MIFPPIDWASPWPWLTATALLALFVLPVWLINQKTGLSAGRKATRLGLNGLLWLALLGLVLQPRWRTQLPTGRVLLVADEVAGTEIPAATVRAVQDSLHISTAIRAKAFRGATDTVVLLGQSFGERLSAQLAKQVVTWIPYDAPNGLLALHWKGIVRRGDQQVVSGKITASGGSKIRLTFGKRTLDSTTLKSGDQSFALSYPVFSQGKTALMLWLNETVLDTIRFVARPAGRLRIRFVFTAPDFETRTLADWLGQQGHQVELSNTLSKGIGSTITLNTPTTTRNTLPDLFITDPANVTNALIRSGLTTGKNVLVLNLSNPDADIATINRALQTRWQVRRVPGKDSLRVGPSLTALPYRFVPSAVTLPIENYPVMVQPGRANGRVAVSLLTETFPLKLGGDSAAYERLWLSVLAPLMPQSANNLDYEAPVFKDVTTALTLNNPAMVPSLLRLGSDTITLQPDPINTRSWRGMVRPAKAGWQPMQDTLAVYVQDAQGPGALVTLAQRQKTAAVALAHRRYDTKRPTEARFIEKELPNWAWFVLIVSLLTAIWIEPKLG